MDESPQPAAASRPVSIDLSELDLAPAWVTREGSAGGSVTWGVAERSSEGGRGGRREGREGRGGGSTAEARGGGDRRQRSHGREGRPPEGRREGHRGPPGASDRSGPPRPAGERRGGPPAPFRRESGGPPRGRGDFDRGRRDRRGEDRHGRGRDDRETSERRVEPAPPPGWEATVLPEPAGIESLSRQIKATGRAYAVFDLARLFLASAERFRLRFRSRHDAQPRVLTLCSPDGSLWLSREEAQQHFVRAHLLKHYFTEERVPVDPPKGVFTAIAVCGLSGTVLGPPNFHAYQRNLVHLHQERFRGMPIEKFKSRVRIERDDEAVRKWIESQSSQSHYTLTDESGNPVMFTSEEAAVAYLFETRPGEIFADAPNAAIPGTLNPTLMSRPLYVLARSAIERQRQFPIQLVQELCRQFDQAGLRFFKENKRETYVSRSRPRPFNPATAVSDRVHAIIEFIRSHPSCDYRAVVIGLAPNSASVVEAPKPPEAISRPAISRETAETTAAEPAKEPAAAAAGDVSAAAETTVPSETDREGIAILQDLRWLIREGYVTEFADGRLRVVERAERMATVSGPRRIRLPARGFTVWTQPYVQRPPRRLRLPGRGFTVWASAYAPEPDRGPLSLPGRGFTVWTAPAGNYRGRAGAPE